MTRRFTPGLPTVGVALAVVVYLWCWVFLGQSFYAHRGSSDAVFYQPYGLQMRAGHLPYRDFAVEYPPGALPVFVAPTYVGHPNNLADYERWFGRLMCALGLGSLLLVALARPPAWGLALVAVSPLLIGSLAPERFDLWPTALTIAAVVSLLSDRHWLGWGLLGGAVAAKIYPLALVPLAAVWTFRRRGASSLAASTAVALVVVALAFGPFVVLAPHQLWASLWAEASRPMQIETLAASYLMTFGHPSTVFVYQSYGIEKHGTLMTLASVAQLATLLWIWTAFARGAASKDRFVRYAAASVCAFIAFGRVFSPQYLVWLVPLIALVRGYRGLVATAMLVVLFILTNFWYGTHRFDVYIATGRYGWLLLTRNVIVVVLVVLLAAPAIRLRAPVSHLRTGRSG